MEVLKTTLWAEDHLTSFQLCKGLSLVSGCHLRHSYTLSEGDTTHLLWSCLLKRMNCLLEVFIALHWLQRKPRQLVKARLDDKIKLSFEELKLGDECHFYTLKNKPSFECLGCFWKWNFITFEIAILSMLLHCEWWKSIRQ